MSLFTKTFNTRAGALPPVRLTPALRPPEGASAPPPAFGGGTLPATAARAASASNKEKKFRFFLPFA